MIFWITGNTGAGKTTLANKIKKQCPEAIILDGDAIRAKDNNWDFSEQSRWQHNLRVAREAARLSGDGNIVIVALIAPYKALRAEIKNICAPVFIYLKGGGEPSEVYPYEPPEGTLEFKIGL